MRRFAPQQLNSVVVCGILLLALHSLIFAPPASAEMITTEGVVAITGENMAIFREKAIDDALRRAVEQAVGTLISSDTMTNNFQVVHDKILAQTSGHVKSYQIIKEERLGQEFRVTVMADVGRESLQRTLDALGLLHQLKDKPKVMVLIEEKVGGLYGTTAWENVGQAESTIMERLMAAGFNVVDPAQVRANIPRDKALRLLEGDQKAAAAAGIQYGAQVVITGRASPKMPARSFSERRCSRYRRHCKPAWFDRTTVGSSRHGASKARRRISMRCRVVHSPLRRRARSFRIL